MKLNIVAALAILLLGITKGMLGQETISPTGGNATSDQGSVSYTVGQVFYTSVAKENGSISEGVQQAFEIFVVSATPDYPNINLEISAYPNPTARSLTLNIDKAECKELEKLSYQLYNIDGRLLKKETITEHETMLDLQDLKQASYFLKIVNSQAEIKTFKVVKTQ
ncbi:MAG: T9SS type A sorting domain-containing protein [Salinivirgaceae bacterium]|jgi:hypothetical protein|nr:T9SS type A sorting domain-containing protein [Salinivirgaceae bacterium]